MQPYKRVWPARQRFTLHGPAQKLGGGPAGLAARCYLLSLCGRGTVQEHQMDIGAQLREARELRGLTIAAVAATTRVPVRMLEAIEHNAREALPARPYARGFVIAFAREVGLDAHQIVRDYFAQFEEPPAAVEAPPPEPPPSRLRRRLWVPGFGVFALAIALGAFAMRRGESPPQPIPEAVGTSGTAVVTPPLPPPPRTAGNDAPVAAV